MEIGKNTHNEKRYSFYKGWMGVTLGEQKTVKDEILAVFGHGSRPFWTKLLYGRKPLTMDEMESIEKVFANHKIKKSNIWGS